MIKYILSIIIVLLSQNSINQVKADDPTLLVIYSSPSTLSNYVFNRINLDDGSLNLTLSSIYQYRGKMMGLYSMWGDYQYYMMSFGDGNYYITNYAINNGHSYISSAYMNYYDCYPEITDFTIQRISYDSSINFKFYVGWSKKTSEMLIIGFDDCCNQMYFYYNETDYQVSPQYQNSLVQTYDPSDYTMYINYIDPSTNQRVLLSKKVLYAETGDSFQEYDFVNDLVPVENTVYLMQTSIGPSSNNIYMIEITNSTSSSSPSSSSSSINLYSVSFSNGQATNKLILSFDNNFGANDDGIPYAYVKNTDSFFFILSKPSSTTQYTISKIDLLSLTVIDTITTNISNKNNWGLFYQTK